MSLVVITGGARSGKSSAAQRLVAAAHEEAVVVVAAHGASDGEMARRVARHRAERPATYRTVEAHEGTPWTGEVPADACLLVDCLGTLIGQIIGRVFGMHGETVRADDLVSDETEAAVEQTVDALVDWLVARQADTVVVTNEVGSGIVPTFPDARLFRDVLGRANRRLIDAADAANLAVGGRLIDLTSLPHDVVWPGEE